MGRFYSRNLFRKKHNQVAVIKANDKNHRDTNQPTQKQTHLN